MQKLSCSQKEEKNQMTKQVDIKESKSVLLPFDCWCQTSQGSDSLPFLDSLKGALLPPLLMFL